jgi:hypothetical protein
MWHRIFKFNERLEPMTADLLLGSKSVPLLLVHHPRARRYRLRLLADGTVRVTIPPRGTTSVARNFAARHAGWLEEQFRRLAAQPKTPEAWKPGTTILFRGAPARIELWADGAIGFGTERLPVADPASDLRPAIQRHLWRLAARELPARVRQLADLHDVNFNRVSVRSQKTRWGSCSRRGTISLNWRLIQTPGFVRDYVILHELAHRRHMNHSPEFWQEVARLCDGAGPARAWLRRNGELLR